MWRRSRFLRRRSRPPADPQRGHRLSAPGKQGAADPLRISGTGGHLRICPNLRRVSIDACPRLANHCSIAAGAVTHAGSPPFTTAPARADVRFPDRHATLVR
jgi:hypothetical protein